MKKIRIILSVLIAVNILSVCNVNAQTFQRDTSYYVTYPGTLTTRFYFSKKYATFTFPAMDNEKSIQYRPNTKLNMGIGASYRGLSLNIGYGFGFLNNNNEKGKTTSLDLQLHIYPHNKWAIDVLGIATKGYYLSPKGYAAPDLNSYYYRPDIKTDFICIAAYRVANGERFSYHAAMTQNEWQKKSAGSLLYGGEAYYGTIKADSALVPNEIKNKFPEEGINSIRVFSVGPGVGYAYTAVIANHFFITGSLIANLNLNFSSEKGTNGQKNKLAINPAAIYKAAIGYNSNTWSVSASWAGNALWAKGTSSSDPYSLTTGNYRLTLAKKILLKKH